MAVSGKSGEPRHLLGISDLTPEGIREILADAEAFRDVMRRPIKKVPTLRGRVVVNLFFESSTRTRTSFEIAGKLLSADVINFTASGSSVSKGETLLDTARSIEAMGADVVVVRSASAGVPALLARRLGCSVLNAGDGAHEHPSQALLDALTLTDHLGALEGRSVAIVGDIRRSRVAGSNIRCLSRLGAAVRLCGPPTLIPPGVERLGTVSVHGRVEEALEGADAVMMLRVQKERSGEPLLPSDREYARLYGLNPARAALLKPEAPVLHPGPLNRGVEIDPAVADGARSVILDQVENGVALRMALLYLSVPPAAGEVSAPPAA